MAEIVGVVGAYPHTDALFAKPIELSSGDVAVVRPLGSVAGGAGAAFARQARQIDGFDFDFSELPVVNYLSAREHGAALTALPIFLTRRFVQNMLIVDRDVVRTPKDLEGRRVGLLYYGHSDGTWLRGILAEHYGVDVSAITWITETEEQVGRAVLPGNVVHIPRTSVAEMLAAGEVVARITTPAFEPAPAGGRNIGPLWPDVAATDAEWYAHSRIVPLLHTLVVKRAVLEADAAFGHDLYEAFKRSRDEAVAAALAGLALPEPDLRRATGSGLPTTVAGADPDPIPYGLEANRHALETLMRMASGMQVVAGGHPLDELFLPFD